MYTIVFSITIPVIETKKQTCICIIFTCAHGAAAGVLVPSVLGVRFFSFLPPPDAFFFALVTLIGCGVPGRGSSTSRSYGAKRDGGGAAAPAAPWPFPSNAGLGVPAADRGGATAPSGISPVLSMTKVCAAGVGELRNPGKRGVAAEYTRVSARFPKPHADGGGTGKGGRRLTLCGQRRQVVESDHRDGVYVCGVHTRRAGR